MPTEPGRIPNSSTMILSTFLLINDFVTFKSEALVIHPIIHNYERLEPNSSLERIYDVSKAILES